ncbi:S26 family signal peptidase [Sphingomonas oryzagri]
MSVALPDGRDLPLIAWGEELRRRKVARRKLQRRAILATAFVAITLSPTAVSPTPRLVWNATASAPIGLYWIGPADDLVRDDLVVARLAPDAGRLASDRAYLPLGVPVVKHVGGVPGDRICGSVAAVTIDGRITVRRLRSDGRGRPLPAWFGCMTLRSDQVLLLNADVPDSFDGRYFGSTGRRLIIGKAYPLWLR